MTLTADLRAKLLDAPGIAGTVGERVFPKYRPQDSDLPAVVLHVITGSLDQSFQGPMGTQPRQFQADCMASTKEEAENLRDAVMQVLIAPGAAGAANFQGGFITMFRDDYENTTAGKVHTEQVRATIWFN